MKILLFIFYCFFIAIPVFSYGADTYKYRRCYTQFLREKLDESNPLLQAVVLGKVTAEKACLELLNITYSKNDQLLIKDDVNSLKVFRTFLSKFKAWFPSYELNVATQDYSASDFYDVNEMSFHLMYSFFSEKYNFSKILTSDHSFKAIRVSSFFPKYLFDDALDNPYERQGAIEWERGDQKKWKPKLIDFGTYKGIIKYNGQENNLAKSINGNFSYHDANKSLGSGIIGTMPYILLNSGQHDGIMDGGLKVHRRWAKAVLHDLLCIDLPNITKDEAENFIDKKSQIIFKRKPECMQCHVAMDSLAGVIRNVELYNTSEDGFKKISLRSAYVHPIKKTSNYYYNSSTEGELVTKNLGKLQIEKVNSLRDLGILLSKKNEFYSCTVKKVYSFLTGREIDQYEKVKEEKFISNLTSKLKSEGQLKEIVYDIIKSEFYL